MRAPLPLAVASAYLVAVPATIAARAARSMAGLSPCRSVGLDLAMPGPPGHTQLTEACQPQRGQPAATRTALAQAFCPLHWRHKLEGRPP